MIVHIAAESLEKGHGVCRVPGVGPTTMGIVKDWLGHCRVTGAAGDRPERRPTAGGLPRDPGPAPAAVLLRQPASTFPWSTATSRLDLDHVQPYVSRMRGGSPGQTRIDNETPNARGEHRAVTHGGRNRRQPDPGVMLYRATHGDIYLTNHSGTHYLGDGTFARAIWRLAGRGHDQQPGRLGRS